MLAGVAGGTAASGVGAGGGDMGTAAALADGAASDEDMAASALGEMGSGCTSGSGGIKLGISPDDDANDSKSGRSDDGEADAAKVGGGAVWRLYPHCPQKLASACTGAWQLGQAIISGSGV